VWGGGKGGSRKAVATGAIVGESERFLSLLRFLARIGEVKYNVVLKSV
jgi:hypothetical protein